MEMSIDVRGWRGDHSRRPRHSVRTAVSCKDFLDGVVRGIMKIGKMMVALSDVRVWLGLALGLGPGFRGSLLTRTAHHCSVTEESKGVVLTSSWVRCKTRLSQNFTNGHIGWQTSLQKNC